METTTRARRGGLVALTLGGFLLLGSARAAHADEPVTAADADAMAQAAAQQADQYRQLGGVAYKTGLVQRAEAEASRYSSMAEEMSAPPMTITSPEADHYARLADQYKQMGGVGYKTGLVQRAEADQRRAQEEAAAAATPTEQPPASWVDPWAPPSDESHPWDEPAEGYQR
ncbi:MAG TPA: hypothetical protein VN853_06685 [Polyangia bacterium]|nr:hypothetical protein [Polyangia bacterium]